MPAALELTGKRFDRLLVIRKMDYRKNNSIVWECLCDCGNTTYVAGGTLNYGTTKSCGCLQKEVASSLGKVANLKHGLSKHPYLFEAWNCIKDRCLNANDPSFDRYGGRGITICQEWVNDFAKFVEDVGERPDSSYSIDRIDNSLGYFKENIRWATRAEQSRNRRKFRNNTSGYTGVYLMSNRYWRGTAVHPETGKEISRLFSISKFGNEKAKELAIEARNLLIEEFNKLGAGYTEQHGK